MFFVLIFLILAATTSYLFPDWSWGAVLLSTFGAVAVLLAAKSRSVNSSNAKE